MIDVNHPSFQCEGVENGERDITEKPRKAPKKNNVPLIVVSVIATLVLFIIVYNLTKKNKK
jgi:flagellar basal body-associated protein FliL